VNWNFVEDTRDLARFGYRQALDRSLGGVSSFAAGFSYISILTGVFQLFYLGFAAAGPAFFWTWPVVLLGQITVALNFAELAAHYPLSGGIYQWAKRVGSPGLGWMTGWVYLAGSVITLAAVSLALQGTLPQISTAFQLVGDGTQEGDQARNAVLLGCLLIALTTSINAFGVRWMARINNAGVFAELFGVGLLLVLLILHARRGPEILFETKGSGDGSPSSLGSFLGASIMACYVLYGFDTAGSLAEETRESRRRAPWAILQALIAAGLAGGLLILFSLLSVGDPGRPDLGQIHGGLPSIIKEVLGLTVGRLFLVVVVFAITVCTLAVHTSAVRLMFAMARDNALPFARPLARVREETGAPIVPSAVIGALAAILLLVNVNLPHLIETMCSVAIVWANLSYLMVTLPLLRNRCRGWPHCASSDEPSPSVALPSTALFSLGRWGLPVNVIAVVWGILVVSNMSWPRIEIYGEDAWGRLSAPLLTLGLLGSGWLYYTTVQRSQVGIRPEHAAVDFVSLESPMPDRLGGADGFVHPLGANE
jgi:urea carboxylase system permease